jgi:hypothetical protein
MHKCALKRPTPHNDFYKSGDSGDIKATRVATRVLLTALALSPVFALVACVACQKTCPYMRDLIKNQVPDFLNSRAHGTRFLTGDTGDKV